MMMTANVYLVLSTLQEQLWRLYKNLNKRVQNYSLFLVHMTFIYSIQTIAMLLPEIVNSFCRYFKILPEYHLFCEILPESTGQEFISRPSLTCKQFTHNVNTPYCAMFFIISNFFFNVSVSFTKKTPVHISSITHRTLLVSLFVKWMEEQLIYFTLKDSLKSLRSISIFIISIKNCNSSFTVQKPIWL